MNLRASIEEMLSNRSTEVEEWIKADSEAISDVRMEIQEVSGSCELVRVHSEMIAEIRSDLEDLTSLGMDKLHKDLQESSCHMHAQAEVTGARLIAHAEAMSHMRTELCELNTWMEHQKNETTARRVASLGNALSRLDVAVEELTSQGKVQVEATARVRVSLQELLMDQLGHSELIKEMQTEIREVSRRWQVFVGDTNEKIAGNTEVIAGLRAGLQDLASNRLDGNDRQIGCMACREENPEKWLVTLRQSKSCA